MSTPELDRRGFLRAAGLVGALPLLSPLAGTTAASAVATAATSGTALPAPAAWRLRPFALADVSLGPGVFADKRDLMLDYARGYDVNRLLQVFRANAGLPTLGAVAPGGWEGLDGEANGNLRGHYTGHFLSMLSQAYASTGEQVYADKISTMVGALVECRQALNQPPSVRSVPGRFGTAVESQRGSYQFAQLPTTVLGTAVQLTFAAWVKPGHDAAWARIFDFGNDTTRYMYLAARNQNGVPRFAITTGGGGREQGINANVSLPVGEWSHVALTLAGTVGTLYVNGVVAGRNTAMTLGPAQLGQLASYWLGRSLYPDPVYAGAFDDVNLWSRALTDIEVAALRTQPAYAAPAGRGDLASYDLDETGGQVLHDWSGRAQHASWLRTWGGPSHPGFLAAYPETQFITLETMTAPNYLVVWAPYYTAHKILRGLLDAHLATGDARALDLAEGMCDWMYARLSRLPAATLQRMWGIFSSGEYGGIVEAICDLHALTGKAEYVALAKLFDLNRLIDSCAGAQDILDGLHANQHIPILTGLVRLHDETGDDRYLAAAKGFWNMVVPPRMYSIGGTSTGEFWRASGRIAGTISDTNAETCCAYNMLKLSRMLFFHEQNPKYMEYYERALVNQVLGSKQDKADAEKPLVTYFIGLTPGHVRDYTPKQGTTCCEGTGMESATKYQDSVFFAAADGSALYLNLFIASTLRWAANGVTVEQSTTFPVEQGTRLTIHGNATFDLMVRVPSWVGPDFAVTVNGKTLKVDAVPGTYLRVARSWRSGDVVTVSLPFTLRTETAPDDRSLQSLCYGPVNLVTRDASRSYRSFGLYRNAALSGDLLPSLTPVEARPLHFTLDGHQVAPFYEGTEDPTHVYFRRSEPTVVFGGRNSGVANPVRANGSSLLDELWSGAPYGSKTELLKTLDTLTNSWVTDGLLSAGDRSAVLAAAKGATFVA
ncbi:beta-L-arabinofuranosidase domain-containing protein [Micromonospora deserti]|uniref:Glycosylase n=1 Tax=Micromonospora deserti TaxID=2070366 RepID=A0A2W2DFD7_9ACTN|nr:beta-L-arabinofuranosidase domain-containing protein [Micromonospora deserti]PZG02629.1 glycosylase [Micromonospora deserti]